MLPDGDYQREGKPVLGHIVEIQEQIRAEGMCGAVFGSGAAEESICLREPGHQLPHGRVQEDPPETTKGTT